MMGILFLKKFKRRGEREKKKDVGWEEMRTKLALND
jgi:hypothetical protein